jgi:uncharacterized membrane protein
METNRLSKNTYSFGISLAVCSILNALVVIVKETSKTAAGWMQKMTGHHWTTHVLFVVAIFLALGFALRPKNAGAGPQAANARLLRTVAGGTVAGLAIILGFYMFID